MKIFIRALRDFSRFHGIKSFVFLCLFGVFTSSIAVAEPLVFAQVLHLVEDFLKNNVFDIPALIFYAIFWGGFIILSIIIQYIYRYYLVDRSILAFYVKHSLQITSEKALNISYGSYLQKKSGETFKRLDRGRGAFLHFYFFFFLDIIKNLSGIFLIIVFMLCINVKMTLATIAGVPVAIFIGYFFNKKTIALQRENNKKEDKIYGIIGDGLSNFGLLKILNLESLISKNFNTGMDYLLEKQYAISKRWSVANIYVSALVMIVRIIVLMFGIFLMSQGEIGLAELFLFFSYVGWLYFPLGFIFGQLRSVQEWHTGLEKYYEEFEDTIELENLNTGKNITSVKGNIVFKDVSFGYTDDKKILKNINLSIERGQQIALVGNTGAGKSTVVNLMLRFWEVDSGEVLLDGMNIAELKKSALRQQIGVVSQDNSLFNLSIEENLKFAKPTATKKEIEEALRNAEADFVFELKDGIKTMIGERGLKLSGGEKQRISLARLFLKNPKILILDEATSALDNVTEKKIEAALKKLMKGKTSIIIAHRLSTIQHADSIYMLENGKIVESGNYKTLMQKKGKFYKLANPDKLILG